MLHYRTEGQVLPIGAAAKLTSSQLCSVNSSSTCLTAFQLWPPLLSSFQLFSDHLSSSLFSQLSQQLSSLFISSHLSSTIFTSSHLFSTLLNGSQLCHLFSTLLISSQLFSPLSASSSAQLISPPSQLMSTLLTSCHLVNSSQLFPPLFTEMLYTEPAFTHRSFYTETLSHREALHK